MAFARLVLEAAASTVLSFTPCSRSTSAVCSPRAGTGPFGPAFPTEKSSGLNRSGGVIVCEFGSTSVTNPALSAVGFKQNPQAFWWWSAPSYRRAVTVIATLAFGQSLLHPLLDRCQLCLVGWIQSRRPRALARPQSLHLRCWTAGTTHRICQTEPLRLHTRTSQSRR